VERIRGPALDVDTEQLLRKRLADLFDPLRPPMRLPHERQMISITNKAIIAEREKSGRVECSVPMFLPGEMGSVLAVRRVC
jgi:hypothetical protein